MTAKRYDAVVIGAGPAGCAAALVLARAGARTLVLDPDPPPREKVCGDGLLDDAWAELERLGVAPRVERHAFRGGRARLWSPGGVELELDLRVRLVPRRVLDASLLEAAREAGAEFERGRAVAALPGAAGVRVETADGRGWQARVAVAATGARRSQAPRTAGCHAPPAPQAVAVRRYLRAGRGRDFVAVTYDASVIPGYGWVFPVGDGLFNVGCGAFRWRPPRESLGRVFDRFLARSPAVADLARSGTFEGPLRAAPIRCGPPDRPAVAPGPVLWAGEALGTTYPFTAEGIGPALRSGVRAGEAAVGFLERGEGALRAYRQWVAGRLAPAYGAYRTAERWLARPWVCDLLARRARRNPALRRTFVDVLRGAASPDRVFSPWGLARALLGLGPRQPPAGPGRD
ncbi:NAD(P)/FAD-dependent oxidoreductase [Deferrisoma camini]|uniref:NAD(P)/FAD-dependent oxidoreductase n=1 Tax=Deferrisoma camini TaxID=1035120 RepID=UPI00046D3C93|nr:NAD(P)/FAD-dependent oxidoreductase [Deferrisoma camini]